LLMGSGLSVDADAESAYAFIACADACCRRDAAQVAKELDAAHHVGVRVSRSALMHTKRREITMIRQIPDSLERERAEEHVARRSIEFERAIEDGRIVVGDTLLHIAARAGSPACVEFLLHHGFDACILDANGIGKVPSEVAATRLIRQQLDDLALVIEVAGHRFSLQNIAWQAVGSARRVFSVWHFNSLHETGCIVRAITGLRRSDEQFLPVCRIVAAEAKRAGVAVHREGLKLGYLLLDATFDPETRTYDPVAAEEAFQSLPDELIDVHWKRICDYFLWGDPYWESRYAAAGGGMDPTPEAFRIDLYREWIRVAVRYWIQIACAARKHEMDDLKNEERAEQELEAAKKKKIKDMLIAERKGVERDEDWVAEVVKEDDPVEIFIADHAPTWKKLYSKTGKIPKEMKSFFRENGLKKSRARVVLGIAKGAKITVTKAQMKASILGHDPLERAVWSARLVPPGRPEQVSADMGALIEFTGMPDLLEVRVQRTEGPDGKVIEQFHQVEGDAARDDI
jgi:hypothetical protein